MTIRLFSIILFFELVPITNTKCLLWYQFSHTSEREGTHRENRWGGEYRYAYADTQWAMGFGFESLDQLLSCNDQEMYFQCDRAQKIIDLYTMKNDLPIVTIGCSNSIACASPLPNNNGKYWCQNMDSYDKCISAKIMIDNLTQSDRYPIECDFSVMLSDNIPILNYSKADPITTTITITTSTPSNNITYTTISDTTMPSLSSTVTYSFVLYFILFLSFIY
jgi:hypothetical protein